MLTIEHLLLLMYKIFTFLLLLNNVSFAQKNIKAIYGFDIAYNLHSLQNEALNNRHINIESQAGDTNSKNIAIKIELIKAIYKHSELVIETDDNKSKRTWFSNTENFNKTIPVSKNHKVISKSNGYSFQIISLKKNIQYVEFKNSTDSGKYYVAIDTTVLKFSPTGNEKRINKWYCKEYAPMFDSTSNIRLWLSDDIPKYVHPHIFATNIPKGVVQVDFLGKGSIYLKQILPSFITNEINFENVNILTESVNLLNHQINEL